MAGVGAEVMIIYSFCEFSKHLGPRSITSGMGEISVSCFLSTSCATSSPDLGGGGSISSGEGGVLAVSCPPLVRPVVQI